MNEKPKWKYTNAKEGNAVLKKLCAEAGIEYVPEHYISRLNAKIEEAQKAASYIATPSQPATTAPLPTPKAKHTGPDYTALSLAALNHYGKAGVRNILASVPRGESAMDQIERRLFSDGVKVPGWDFGALEAKLGRARPMFGLRRTEAALQTELAKLK